MKVLVACEFSGRVRDAFSRLGHDATSCDLLPSDSPGKHFQGDVREIINNDFELLIAHPPCTFITLSNSKNWKMLQENGKQQEAIKFVEDIWESNCPRICIENPVGALSTRSKLGKPTQYIEPYYFGHAEQKKTGLWLKGLPKLEPTKVIDISHLPPKQRQRLHWLPPSKDRWKLRSLTYLGIAEAMAEQWGEKYPLQNDLQGA